MSGNLKKARVTTRDGQIIFHRLIREYKAANPRPKDQSAADYQQETEAWARRELPAALEALAWARYEAIQNGLEPPAAH